MSVAEYIQFCPSMSNQKHVGEPVAVVTGGSRGLGRGIATALVEDGLIVFAAGRSISTAELPIQPEVFLNINFLPQSSIRSGVSRATRVRICDQMGSAQTI